jgi:nucleoside-diphosphate-sugar epimerase
VTGATGFVGANLVRALLKQGIEVFITARESSNFWRLKDIQNMINQIYFVDLTESEKVTRTIKELNPRIIYHTATYGGLPNQTDKDQMIKSNLVATVNLLDAAINCGVEQFINTGSSSEYGIKDKPMKEEDCCMPLGFYGITKLAATNYCSMVGQLNNYRVCTLRLFSPYGEFEDQKRLYPSIVNALLKGKGPKLSRPDSVRDFIPIEKVVKVFINVINANYSPGDIINVGSGKQQTIEEFYCHVAQTMGAVNIKPIWNQTSFRFNEPDRWEADVSKLRSLGLLD